MSPAVYVVKPVPPLPVVNVPASVIVPLVVTGPPLVVRPVVPPDTFTLVTLPPPTADVQENPPAVVYFRNVPSVGASINAVVLAALWYRILLVVPPDTLVAEDAEPTERALWAVQPGAEAPAVMTYPLVPRANLVRVVVPDA